MVTCTWNNASIDNQAQFIDSLPQSHPRPSPAIQRRQKQGFVLSVPSLPLILLHTEKGLGTRLIGIYYSYTYSYMLVLICHTTTIDPFPLGMVEKADFSVGRWAWACWKVDKSRIKGDELCLGSCRQFQLSQCQRMLQSLCVLDLVITPQHDL